MDEARATQAQTFIRILKTGGCTRSCSESLLNPCHGTMPRGRGGRIRSLRLSTRTSSPAVKKVQQHVLSDEEMADVDADVDVDAEADKTRETWTHQEEQDDPTHTPTADEDGDGDGDAPEDEASSPPVIQSIPRKRGRGRPPRIPRPDFTPEPGLEDASESGTPKRRRGRPSGSGLRGGFRGRPKGGPSHATRVPIDKEGNMMDVINDEVALPEDDEGETKVDKNGHLQGGRDYRVRVFTILGRGDRLYMLSTEPARCTGFRDSYLFFTKHLQLYKIIIDENEKKDLIARDLIPHSYKGRAIGVVTARSVFREFGARIVIGGKKITDDYYVQAAKDRGDIEGQLADPTDRLPGPGEPYNKNQYVAWHGASSVYHNNAPSVPLQPGKPAPGKRKANVTTVNWQFEHAREATRFNSTLTSLRRANLGGIYDCHTNLIFYPKIMQPSHVRWDQVFDEADTPSQQTDKVHINGNRPLTNGDSTHSTSSNGPLEPSQRTNPRQPPVQFKPVPAVVARNRLVTDIYFESPPISNLGFPGPDGDVHDLGTNGLSEIAQDVLDELPTELRAAFEEAKRAELGWKTKWGNEQSDGSRGKLRIGFNGFPV